MRLSPTRVGGQIDYPEADCCPYPWILVAETDADACPRASTVSECPRITNRSVASLEKLAGCLANRPQVGTTCELRRNFETLPLPGSYKMVAVAAI